ncbi:hypothetical protein PPYR_05521 [Photinus pyralis]|uniref:Protein hook n=1 Tax=Photinus pyralis TaxID=7054 RepID=A0A1Y1KBS6_PHOPY|nr:protein hook [Photinus pyralis]KAB0801167.1 hypothetical protein PPYR_05521 [Photinus pyralis]
MDPSEEVSKSLVKWLQALVSKGTKTLEEISDGVAICQVLVQIAPEHFSILEPKIKADSSNWRLRVSNLKKIVERIFEYYQDVLNLTVLDIGKPDAVRIGEACNLVQLGKLLRLILGCAINCDRKQEYITQFLALEETVQQSIMQAIQQLEEVTGNTGRTEFSLISMESDTRIIKLMQDLEVANDAKETLAQQCHNLEVQVQCLLEEKQVLLTDNQLLTTQAKERENMENIRSPDNRRQLDLLKDEIFKLETCRDDYRAKTLEQDRQIAQLQEKISELQLAADAAVHLKDEVDALSESADKVKVLEQAVISYKKKLEGYGDIKKQLKHLEDKNLEYYQQNMTYEEELKNGIAWKNQCEMYKKQAADLQQKLDEETQKSQRAAYQTKNIESKYTALVSEKDRLTLERNILREEIDELKLGKQQVTNGADVARELAPTEMKERLHFLEKEITTLRSTGQDACAKQALLDDALSRIEKLTEQNRNANQKVMELETQLQDQQRTQMDDYATQLEGSIKEYKQRILSLQDAINAKDTELHANQIKYTRNLEKAREVAQSLDPRSETIESIRQNNMKDMESQMLSVAFYRLCLARHRESVDERLAMLSAGQGSFLARQRQPTPRKPVQPFKSK